MMIDLIGIPHYANENARYNPELAEKMERERRRHIHLVYLPESEVMRRLDQEIYYGKTQETQCLNV